MKKIYLPLTCLLMICLSAVAQIPNPSFENWTGNTPNGWETNNYTAIPNAVESVTPGHASTTAAKLFAYPFPGTFQAYEPNLSIVYASNLKPASLHFWYKLSSGGSGMDGIVSIQAYLGNSMVGSGDSTISTYTSVFKEMVVKMVYTGSTVDSLLIAFRTDSHGGALTEFIVDDLSWTTTSSVSEVNQKGFVLAGALQNPSSGMTDIIYNLPVAANVSLGVFDVSGKELKLLVNEKQSAGRFKAQLNADELPAGIYFCHLNADGAMLTTKLIIVR